MTSAEMIQAFKVLYDVANLEGPGYENDEILVMLNQAQSIEVLKEVKLGRLDFISNLIVNESGQAAADLSYSYHYRYAVVNEPLNVLSAKALITRATFKIINPAAWVETEIIDKRDNGLYITNTNNKPILLRPVIFTESAMDIGLLVDSLTSVSAVNPNIIVEYVRKPTDITVGVDSIVNTSLHERIVNTAVDIGKKVFNPQEAGISQQADQIMNNPKV